MDESPTKHNAAEEMSALQTQVRQFLQVDDGDDDNDVYDNDNDHEHYDADEDDEDDDQHQHYSEPVTIVDESSTTRVVTTVEDADDGGDDSATSLHSRSLRRNRRNFAIPMPGQQQQQHQSAATATATANTPARHHHNQHNQTGAPVTPPTPPVRSPLTFNISPRGPPPPLPAPRSMSHGSFLGQTPSHTQSQSHSHSHSHNHSQVQGQSPAHTQGQHGNISTLGKYQLVHQLGCGYYGNTYSAIVSDASEHVAVKMMDGNRLNYNQQCTLRKDFDVLKSLSFNQNIVQYIALVAGGDHAHGTVGVVQEFVENGSLADIHRRLGPVPESLLSKYVTQVLETLHYLHQQDIIHRNIKATNIMLSKAGQVKLSDFALGSTLGSTYRHSLVGDPNWQAPELLLMRDYTSKVDIWALGCAIVETVTGHPPYPTLPPMEALVRIVDEKRHMDLPKGVSRDLASFLQGCFTRNPLERPSAEQLLKHPWVLGAAIGSANQQQQDAAAAAFTSLLNQPPPQVWPKQRDGPVGKASRRALLGRVSRCLTTVGCLQ
ncbi:hypothetical protein SAMD00019534_026810 [Acytostelium subglobosum LB1]|uniref:hypothetical protein n=1 Tax=Acytostelium subglobosum LB1 TaxID=1410327 RepID=UPI000644B61C|nr:hypothetical protein SAMD00019534_026810 [Acytostelium subglobosum LB1]GAM19506.1 hypothetical protein SAMD00019534_026810 [Acytostelium subglobosum LB1]|eukprot:XP_012757433.1 hypothetical protein SAMD00019534_026810 [Acytostelium subglobosum LB1]